MGRENRSRRNLTKKGSDCHSIAICLQRCVHLGGAKGGAQQHPETSLAFLHDRLSQAEQRSGRDELHGNPHSEYRPTDREIRGCVGEKATDGVLEDARPCASFCERNFKLLCWLNTVPIRNGFASKASSIARSSSILTVQLASATNVIAAASCWVDESWCGMG